MLAQLRADWRRWLMVLLALVGLAISAYLMCGYTAPNATLSCGGAHGCDTVKNSVYASVAGIPMPLLGMVAYLSILALLILQGQPLAAVHKRLPYIGLALFGLTLVGVLYSAYLTYLELFVIYAICRWCVTAALVMASLFVLSIFNLQHLNR
jgi:uncharacterized membrane protein